MKLRIPHVLLAVVFTSAALRASPPPESVKIDEILTKSWQRQNAQPHERAPDEVFLRRIHLDIAGRIPTLDEARAFLESRDPQKRAKLIDHLLAGDGYASNFFNYFADILRLQTDARGELAGHAYADWLKAALKKNQPFDSMVRELLTTDGAAWDSGAIGFYMRDRGMPLDHLAATVQVFLGTRLECAQCHNHPFDKWTQIDYYQMAAFTFGVDARRDYTFDTKSLLAGLDRKQLRGPEGDKIRQDMQLVQEAMKPLVKSMAYTRISETDKRPQLPHDYKYDNAKPGQTIAEKTFFGHEAKPRPGETRLDAFAWWMTDRENPRFTTVIANRLWKKVMGMGLIEPVDEMTDSTVPSNGELMTHLEKVMAAGGYDLKQFLRVLFNTEAYQRMPSPKSIVLGETYAFTGPLMRRMSAEQLWDSVVTLIKGDLDASAVAPNEAVEKRLELLETVYERITTQAPADVAARVKTAGRAVGSPEMEARIKAMTEQIETARRAGDTATSRRIAGEIKQLRDGNRSDAIAVVLGESAAREFQEGMKEGYQFRPDRTKFVPARVDKATIQKWTEEGLGEKGVRRRIEALRKEATQGDKNAGVIPGVLRASELPSPAPRGHMLRIFGQSDRETIENATLEPAVPQALTMLNGPVADALVNPGSFLGERLAASEDPRAKAGLIYLALLSRPPTGPEREVLDQVIAERGAKATADIIHALLNTAEFQFVK